MENEGQKVPDKNYYSDGSLKYGLVETNLNAAGTFFRVDNNQYFATASGIGNDLSNDIWGVNQSELGGPSQYVYDYKTESAFDASTDADVTNTVVAGGGPADLGVSFDDDLHVEFSGDHARTRGRYYYNSNGLITRI